MSHNEVDREYYQKSMSSSVVQDRWPYAVHNQIAYPVSTILFRSVHVQCIKIKKIIYYSESVAHSPLLSFHKYLKSQPMWSHSIYIIQFLSCFLTEQVLYLGLIIIICHQIPRDSDIPIQQYDAKVAVKYSRYE